MQPAAPKHVRNKDETQMAENKSDKATDKAVNVEDIVKKAVEKALGSVKPQTVYVSGEKPKKPLYAAQSDVPPEFWTDKTMRIVRMGQRRVFPHFLVHGQAIECPRTQIIRFRKHNGANTRRFGDGNNLNYEEVYDTNDTREQELFRKDDRNGSDFYIDTGKEVSVSELTLMTLFSKHMGLLASASTAEVRGKLVDAGGDLSMSTDEMRAFVANYYAKLEYNKLREASQLHDVGEGRKALMTANA